MANTSEEPVAEGRRFPVDSFRVTVLASIAAAVYGSGIVTAFWAAKLTVAAAHDSRSIPAWPWTIAFALVVGGMLAVIYGFFFRPRELRVGRDRLALVYWDGNGKKLSRDEVDQVTAGARRIVLRGAERKFVVPRIFRDWGEIRAELESWARAPSPSSD